MADYRGSVTEDLLVDADELFALLIDVDRLPEWNQHNHHVVDAPDVLVEGAEWVVETRALGSKWNSRARVLELDTTARRFAHRSSSDDGNPSYGLWTWQVTPTEHGSRITVTWELHPQTFWRKRVLVRIRHRQLQSEVRESLRAAAAALAPGNTTGGPAVT